MPPAVKFAACVRAESVGVAGAKIIRAENLKFEKCDKRATELPVARQLAIAKGLGRVMD